MSLFEYVYLYNSSSYNTYIYVIIIFIIIIYIYIKSTFSLKSFRNVNCAQKYSHKGLLFIFCDKKLFSCTYHIHNIPRTISNYAMLL